MWGGGGGGEGGGGLSHLVIVYVLSSNPKQYGYSIYPLTDSSSLHGMCFFDHKNLGAGIAQWLERRTRDRRGRGFESLQESNFLY